MTSSSFQLGAGPDGSDRGLLGNEPYRIPQLGSSEPLSLIWFGEGLRYGQNGWQLDPADLRVREGKDLADPLHAAITGKTELCGHGHGKAHQVLADHGLGQELGFKAIALAVHRRLLRLIGTFKAVLTRRSE